MQKNKKIDGVIIGKFTNELSTIKDIECGGANEILPEVWQGTLTPNSWFYKIERPLRHSARTIIEMLIDINSKNGNLLLNVELLPNGTIPEEQKMILDDVGDWIKTNSEAIYASKPWKVYGDNLNSVNRKLKEQNRPSETDLEAFAKADEDEQFNERTIHSLPYEHDEVRFTIKDENLYIFVLNPVAGELKLPTLGLKSKYYPGEIQAIRMLGGDNSIQFKQNAQETIINIPTLRPNRYATVFKVTFRKKI